MENLTAFNLFHRLWTKAVGTPNYLKIEWKAMERMVLALEERERILQTIEVMWKTNPRLRNEMLGFVAEIEKRMSVNPREHYDLPEHSESYKPSDQLNGIVLDPTNLPGIELAPGIAACNTKGVHKLEITR